MIPADAIQVPVSLLKEKTNKWNLLSSTVTPGQTGTGHFPRVGMRGGGLWSATISGMWLLTDRHAKTYRAIRMLARNGVVPMVVPRRDAMLSPWPVVDGRQVMKLGALPHSDGAMFGDGAGYDQPLISALSIGPASLRSTSMTIRMVSGSPLEGGESFSIFHPTMGWRLYEIGASVQQDSGDFIVAFGPELREDVPDGTEIEFDNPRCTMRLATPNGMDFVMETYPFAQQEMSLIEAFF